MSKETKLSTKLALLLWVNHLVIALLILWASCVFGALGAIRRIASPASVVSASGTTLLLDESGLGSATLALSTGKIRSAYSGDAVRVRRSSDNAECDVGFLNDWVSLDSPIKNLSAGSGATLKLWAGSDSCYVVKWFDQSGNTNNATQSTAGNQPMIVNAGALVTGSNSRPAIQFTSASSHRMTLAAACPTNSLSACGVVKTDSGTTAQTFIGGESGAFQYNMLATSGYHRFNRYALWGVASSAAITTNWVTLWGHSSGASQTIYKNNASAGTGANSSSFNNNINTVGAANAGVNEHWNGKMHELVIWPADVGSAGVATGSANQNTRFAIY